MYFEHRERVWDCLCRSLPLGASSAPQIPVPQLDLRGHYEVGEREGKGNEGTAKEKKERDERNGRTPRPEINFWLRPLEEREDINWGRSP